MSDEDGYEDEDNYEDESPTPEEVAHLVADQPYHQLPHQLFANSVSISVERHRAANWLIDGGDYDDVSTDT